MRRLKELYGMLFLWWWPVCLAAQTDFLFKSLPSRSEVSQTTINAMLQDRQGFVWLGTWSGLFRYDAYNLRQFGPESGLNSSKITSLFQDTTGVLWVGTRNTGLYVFNADREIFIPASQALQAAHPLAAQNITSVFRDREGLLWIGAEEGLFVYHPQRKDFFQIPLNGITPPPSENIYLYSICQTSDGCIWVAGSHGLYRALPEDTPEKIRVFSQVALHPAGADPRAVEFHNFVYAVKPVQNQPQRLWIGTKQGLKLLDIDPGFLNGQHPMPGKLRYFQHANNDPGSLSHNFVVSICEGNFPGKNSIWIATFNGLNLLDISTGRFRQFYARDDQEGALRASFIRSLMFDQSGMLWIGTNRGINQIDPHYADFRIFPLRRKAEAADESISFLSKTGQNLWVSSFDGGIFRVPLRNDAPQWAQARHYTLDAGNHSPVTDFISAMIPDGQGYIWCITQGAGAFRFQEKQAPPAGGIIRAAQQFTKGNTERSISDDYLMSACVGQSGLVWIGCWDAGINVYDPQADRIFQFTTTSDGKADFHMFPVVSLMEMRENGQVYLLAGTRGGGTFQLQYVADSHQLQLVRRFHREGQGAEYLPDNFITSMLEDEQRQIWLTSESGLFLKPLGADHFQRVEIKNFPVSSHYEAIVASGGQRYWVSTQKGIGCFVFQQGRVENAVFYDSRNGLKERFFNSNAALRLSDGVILFGGGTGVTAFQPESVQPDPHVPQAVITGLRLFNLPVFPGIPTKDHFLLEKSLASIPQLVLSHRDNVVSFEFSGLHYTCPEQHLFAYKLEGFDPNWIYTDATQRMAHYTNLPAGEYHFLVKTANSDGVWNPVPARLPVRILPPWWRSPLAYTLYGMAFLGLLLLVWKLSLIRANYENKIQLERLEKQKLEEINQMKLIFFTNISHELKTPLTLIISPLEEIIRTRSAGSIRLHQTLSMMHRNAVRLLTMINQLLDIRKAEAGLMKMEQEEGNLVQFVSEICLSFRELAQQRHYRFELHADMPELKIWFDPDQLEKVFYNLLSNAFKFTPPGGQIDVRIGADPEKNGAFVLVQDNGRGIPEDKLPFIFERFFRAEDENSDAGGTGIGLSLVKTIVEQHQGQVDVESTPGQGSLFRVWLPLGTPQRSTNSPMPPLQAPAPPTLPPPAPDAQLMEVAGEPAVLLLVEDNPDIRQYLSVHFSDSYKVIEAENGAVGLEKTLEYLPDIILCDISMPGMDGLELTRQIKSRIETSHIPVILLTARTSLIFKIDGMQRGADDYITKPFNLKFLQARVRNLIESRRLLREKYARNLNRLEPDDPAETEYPELDQEFLKNMEAIIHTHLADPDFSVDDLARKLLLNRKQVYRKIKALTNQTPNDYIRSVRLQHAARLLRTQQYTVAEVTYMVGFQDLKYFRERFKAFFGVNPSELEP